MLWTIESYPTCDYHVFLSHSAEDREKLVIPVYQRLRNAGVRPWLDRHDYAYGRGSRAALRDGILACRHAVFFVTPAMLRQPRGWCVQELAWAELLQDNLVAPGGPLQNVLLPLYLVPQSNDRLPRSVWQLGRDRGTFRPNRANRIDWACGQILQFLRREEALADRMAELTLGSNELRDQLHRRPGLVRRVTRFDPAALPPLPR